LGHCNGRFCVVSGHFCGRFWPFLWPFLAIFVAVFVPFWVTVMAVFVPFWATVMAVFVPFWAISVAVSGRFCGRWLFLVMAMAIKAAGRRGHYCWRPPRPLPFSCFSVISPLDFIVGVPALSCGFFRYG
jgi:hypothetical protein